MACVTQLLAAVSSARPALRRTCRMALPCILSPSTTNSAVPSPAAATRSTRSLDTPAPMPMLRYRVPLRPWSRLTNATTSSVFDTCGSQQAQSLCTWLDAEQVSSPFGSEPHRPTCPSVSKMTLLPPAAFRPFVLARESSGSRISVPDTHMVANRTTAL